MNGLEWLNTPLSGGGQHHIAPWAMWHARCMVMAWGVLLPLGALRSSASSSGTGMSRAMPMALRGLFGSLVSL